MTTGPLSKRGEFLGVLALALGFGLVGVDRFLISAMFPTIARDLHISYGGIGIISGALAIAWGAAALTMGALSDRVGRRRVLVISLIVFSLLIGTSGLAASLATLVLVRVLMGFADGAFTPASIAATVMISPEDRHGRNVGLQQTTLVLFGLGLSPPLVAVLLHYMSWRLIFSLFVIPGLLIAWMIWRVIPSRNDVGEAAAVAAPPPPSGGAFAAWRDVLGRRNIWVLMGGMLCWLTLLITISALLPSYLVDYLKLNTGQMGAVMAAIGFGAALGAAVVSWVSDKIGRKPVMLIGTVCASICLFMLHRTGANPGLLFFWLFFTNFFNNGVITLTVGPICTESVPARLMATASGVVIAVGEFFGGGLAPILAGQVAERFGIQNILWLPQATLVVGFFLCLLLTETRPRLKASRPALQEFAS